MESVKRFVILAIGACMGNVAHAGQTVSYVYDALGRLTQTKILSVYKSRISPTVRIYGVVFKRPLAAAR